MSFFSLSREHPHRSVNLTQLNPSSLSAEQSQYFNSLSSQSSTQPQSQQANLVSYQPVAPVQTVSSNIEALRRSIASRTLRTKRQFLPFQNEQQYSSSTYASNLSYGDQVTGQSQIQSAANRNSKRARVPPPSKIPSSAVEMPDTLSNIGCKHTAHGPHSICIPIR